MAIILRFHPTSLLSTFTLNSFFLHFPFLGVYCDGEQKRNRMEETSNSTEIYSETHTKEKLDTGMRTPTPATLRIYPPEPRVPAQTLHDGEDATSFDSR